MLSTSKHGLLSRLRGLQVQIQRLNFTLAELEFEAQLGPEIVPHSEAPEVKIDMSKWKTVDSRSIGITCSMVPDAPYTVLKILHSAGFQGYLVGGCVRDLLLNKPPKDYDIITTATLDEIKAKFHFCGIVGKQFPICKVHVKGSVIEVSSFETVAQHAKKKEKDLLSQTPSHCSERDFLRWRNSMHRDFTINSLFFDPFVYEIYDYANGIADLKALELRTIIPAQLSFTEDCARILRGLRIAARLGLSIPKETDTAIHKLSSSISRLDKFRMMLELNYMLSYGAASSSLHLLWKYKLLKILLPFQAAYLDEKTSKKCAHHSTMLMKLFSNLDKLVTCDKPADCSLWVGLLAFHLALVNNPQDARVVRAFASVLHHGNWKEGVESAREHAQVRKEFVPEISELSDLESDELAKRVSKFASLVQRAIASLADENSLLQSMSRYPGSPCSGVVFVPRKVYNQVYDMFEVLTIDIENYDNGRERFDINYYLLGKGNMLETRFVLGKVILKTMNEGVTRKKKDHLQVHKKVEDDLPPLSDSVNEEMNINNDRKRRLSLLIPAPELRTMRKQKVVEMNSSILKQLEVEIGNGNSQDTVKFPSLLSKRQPIFFDLNKEPIRLATAETMKHEKQVQRVSEKESRKPSQVNDKCDETQDDPTGFASKETSKKKQRPVIVSIEKPGKSQDEQTRFARKEKRKKQGPVSVSNEKQIATKEKRKKQGPVSVSNEKQIATKETKKKQGPVLVSNEKQNRRPVKKESGLPLLSSLFK